MKNAIINLLKVKSIVTLLMTVGMLFLLSNKWRPTREVLMIYSTAYGSIITYFFTKKDSTAEAQNGDNKSSD